MGGDARGFTDVHERLGVSVKHLAAHLLHEFVEARAGHDHREGGAEAVLRGRAVGEAFGLRDEVDDVHAEAVHAAVEPPAHHVVHGLADFGVFPVEVGLFAGKHVQVELLGLLVPLPAGAAEGGVPVVGFGAAFAGLQALHLAGVAPDVPIALGVLARGAGFEEPFVLVARVVDDEVHDEADAVGVEFFDEFVEVVEGAEHRFDVAVVGDVVAVVVLRRGVDG